MLLISRHWLARISLCLIIIFRVWWSLCCCCDNDYDNYHDVEHICQDHHFIWTLVIMIISMIIMIIIMIFTSSDSPFLSGHSWLVCGDQGRPTSPRRSNQNPETWSSSSSWSSRRTHIASSLESESWDIIIVIITVIKEDRYLITAWVRIPRCMYSVQCTTPQCNSERRCLTTRYIYTLYKLCFSH